MAHDAGPPSSAAPGPPGGPPSADTQATADHLIAAALAYPEATLEHPWGHPALKVRGKAFVFLGVFAEGLSFSVKLPTSSHEALMLPFAQPTGYGLGKSGWVTARFGAQDDVPVAILQEWVDESYRAIAPKRLVAKLEIAEKVD